MNDMISRATAALIYDWDRANQTPRVYYVPLNSMRGFQVVGVRSFFVMITIKMKHAKAILIFFLYFTRYLFVMGFILDSRPFITSLPFFNFHLIGVWFFLHGISPKTELYGLKRNLQALKKYLHRCQRLRKLYLGTKSIKAMLEDENWKTMRYRTLKIISTRKWCNAH